MNVEVVLTPTEAKKIIATKFGEEFVQKANFEITFLEPMDVEGSLLTLWETNIKNNKRIQSKQTFNEYWAKLIGDEAHDYLKTPRADIDLGMMLEGMEKRYPEFKPKQQPKKGEQKT